MARTSIVASLALTGLVAALPFASQPLVARQAAQGPDERVAALKQSIQQSQKQLRQYQWVETTTMSLKGEVKSTKQKSCYYGADGTLQKTPIGEAPPAPEPQASGGRGGRLKEKIVEKKKDEMQDYMERAAKLLESYVPPDGDRIQSVKNAGKLTIKPLAEGRVHLDFADYNLAGDHLGIDVDTASNRLLGLNVNTYLDKNDADNAITLTVKMGALSDGTGFNQEITLIAAAKKIQVVVANSGYRPLGK